MGLKLSSLIWWSQNLTEQSVTDQQIRQLTAIYLRRKQRFSAQPVKILRTCTLSRSHYSDCSSSSSSRRRQRQLGPPSSRGNLLPAPRRTLLLLPGTGALLPGGPVTPSPGDPQGPPPGKISAHCPPINTTTNEANSAANDSPGKIVIRL